MVDAWHLRPCGQLRCNTYSVYTFNKNYSSSSFNQTEEEHNQNERFQPAYSANSKEIRQRPSKTAGGKITETCTIHTKPAEKPKEVEKPKDNTTNTANNGNKTNTNTNTNSTSTNSTNTKKDDKTNSGTKTDGTSSTTTNTPSTDTTKTDTNKKHQ